MKESSNNYLVTIAVIAIAISLFSIFLSFGGKLGITGMGTEVGYVNITVPSTAAITVWTTSINFTASAPGSSKYSYESDHVDSREGMPCTTDNYCGMNITNDGTAFINISIRQTEALFTSGTYVANTHWLYNTTMQDPDYGSTKYGNDRQNCSVGYDQGLPTLGTDGWRAVPTTAEQGICYLNFSDTLGGATTESSDTRPDVVRVEFNITVPSDEPAEDKAGTIEFVAAVV